jgi:hypothetical protein
MHLDDTPGDGQPKSGAALLLGNRIVGLLELLEKLGLVGCGNPRSGTKDRSPPDEFPRKPL